jgi:hypothetical protein
MRAPAIKSSTGQVRNRSCGVLFGRTAGALAACLFVLFSLGCMSFWFGTPGCEIITKAGAEDCEVLTQEGRVAVRPASDQVVFYPVAYASPPNLEIEDRFQVCDVVEQKENCFRVHFRASTGGEITVAWKARGMKAAPPADAPPGLDVAPAVPVQPTASAQPAAPVPVSLSVPR